MLQKASVLPITFRGGVSGGDDSVGGVTGVIDDMGGCGGVTGSTGGSSSGSAVGGVGDKWRTAVTCARHNKSTS